MDGEHNDVGELQPVLLVVDDDPMVRKLVVRGLEPLNAAAVIEVEDGAAAQRVLKSRHVDVVITDVLMPNMDGRELMEWAQTNCPEPVWIVLSGLDTFDAAVDALHLGAFDFLAKPPEVQRVRVAVRNALDHLLLARDRQRLFGELEQRNQQMAEKVRQLEELCRMLEDQAELIHADLARAEMIQRALLPQEPPALGEWSAQTLYRSGSYVGGDLYDIIRLDERYLGVVIADAAGHGVAAAMLSVLFKHRLKCWDGEIGEPLMPDQVLKLLNRSLYDDLSAASGFITAVYLLLDRQSGEVWLASAGHPPVIWEQTARSDRQLIKRTGPALGLEADPTYMRAHISVAPGDCLLLYTDGALDSDAGGLSADDLANSILVSEADRSSILQTFYETVASLELPDRDDLTMILLEHKQGISRFNDGGEARQTATAAAPAKSAVLEQGWRGNEAFLTISGTATWMRSSSFLESAQQLLQQYPQLTIDLEHCDYLDSTFLGTLHEVVASKPDAVRLQHLPDSIRALFEELSMQTVLAHVDSAIHPLPGQMRQLRRVEEDAERQAQRLLKAHEVLASLSDENREQFQGVVESLRADIK
jgi:serine phosphatase RsbU (regulator of sigma subunit)/ABC-type transporter Mla MlaB component